MVSTRDFDWFWGAWRSSSIVVGKLDAVLPLFMAPENLSNFFSFSQNVSPNGWVFQNCLIRMKINTFPFTAFINQATSNHFIYFGGSLIKFTQLPFSVNWGFQAVLKIWHDCTSRKKSIWKLCLCFSLLKKHSAPEKEVNRKNVWNQQNPTRPSTYITLTSLRISWKIKPYWEGFPF